MVKSPCIKKCHLNEDFYCTGCYRRSDEIFRWKNLTDEEKASILAELPQRKIKEIEYD